MAGYHNRDIKRGEYGRISKIREELDELEDAAEQNVRIMVGVELADLYGALEAYAAHQGFEMADLESMASLTRRAFMTGHRKARQ